MQPRQRRAIYWTLGVAAILAGPLAFRIWLQSQAGAVAVPRLGDVESFVYHDTKGEAVTREHLRRAVTIVMHIPAQCSDAKCDLARTQAQTTQTWIKDHLTMTYTEEKNPLILLSTGGGYQPGDPSWRSIDEDIVEGALLPRGYPNNHAWLAVIDPWLLFAGAWDLTQPIDHKQLERVLSRTTFEQYMGNYLARRTFMGPKRDPR